MTSDGLQLNFSFTSDDNAVSAARPEFKRQSKWDRRKDKKRQKLVREQQRTAWHRCGIFATLSVR